MPRPSLQILAPIRGFGTRGTRLRARVRINHNTIPCLSIRTNIKVNLLIAKIRREAGGTRSPKAPR
jgi:hypothetical protein